MSLPQFWIYMALLETEVCHLSNLTSIGMQQAKLLMFVVTIVANVTVNQILSQMTHVYLLSKKLRTNNRAVVDRWVIWEQCDQCLPR